jgi:hypothetical protein
MRRTPLATALVSAALVAAASAPAAPDGPSTPSQLLYALLTAPVPGPSPAGPATRVVSAYPLSSNSVAHHSVGAIEIEFPELSSATILYDVFPNRVDAVADFRATTTQAGETKGPAPGSFPKPSLLASGPLSVDGHHAGITGVEFVDGNVIVAAGTVMDANVRHGDVSATIQLALFALRHLVAVRDGH